jgi:hypothetical protein
MQSLSDGVVGRCGNGCSAGSEDEYIRPCGQPATEPSREAGAESKLEFRSVRSIAEMTIGDAQASSGIVLRLRSEES